MRFLTYNVFAGSPVPYIGGGIESLSPTRLNAQIEAVQSLTPNIVFLQELYCNFAVNEYSQLPYLNLIKPKRHWRPLGFFVYFSYVLAISVLVALLPSVVMYFKSGGGNFKVFLLICVAVLLPMIAWGLRFCSLRGWLTGNISGLAILIDKSLQVTDVTFKLFDNQSGDYLNTLSPRGYLTACVKVQGLTMLLCNVHYNRTHSKSRLAQVTETLRVIIDSKSDIVVLAGDFNADITSKEVQFLEDCGFIHVHKSEGRTGNLHFSWSKSNVLSKPLFSKGSHDELIDHILIFSKQNLATVQQSQIVLYQYPLSDHYGLLAKLEIKQ